jgi:benzoyl-CoA 2,3-dioxygenase component A
MPAADTIEITQQHVIDPEVCIRCNTCEETCPVDAITHDGRNYVVDPAICNACNACIAPCPTGSIDHWLAVPKGSTYSLAEQLTWDELPAPLPATIAVVASASAVVQASGVTTVPELDAPMTQTVGSSTLASTSAPWSAAQPHLHLYGTRAPVRATVAGNFRLTSADASSAVHHVVLDFGELTFPILEGQSVGIIPPGVDAQGRPHYPRLYSVASPRGGERPGYNNIGLTVKRVDFDHAGKPVVGVCSNYLCNLAKGDEVALVGPFGATFLMPNHPGSNIVMICTGTGSAPMRAMTEHRRRLWAAGQPLAGKLLLFFGARRPEELPYFGPLTRLPPEFIDINFAFSRVPGEPRCYVQDRMRGRAAEVARLLRDDTYLYICGLKGMEEGVMDALREVSIAAGIDWDACRERFISEGRLHVETY